MEFWFGAAAGFLTGLAGLAGWTALAARKTVSARKHSGEKQPDGAAKLREREDERPSVNALEEQWNNLMRFNGTAQQGGGER